MLMCACVFACRNLITSEDRQVSANYIWKSISHEVGHTLGLAHKGVLHNALHVHICLQEPDNQRRQASQRQLHLEEHLPLFWS